MLCGEYGVFLSLSGRSWRRGGDCLSPRHFSEGIGSNTHEIPLLGECPYQFFLHPPDGVCREIQATFEIEPWYSLEKPDIPSIQHFRNANSRSCIQLCDSQNPLQVSVSQLVLGGGDSF